MRLPRTPRFEVERERFDLRFCCEDCAHFDAREERCRHEWPNELHRQTAQPRDVIDFCKEFDLC